MAISNLVNTGTVVAHIQTNTDTPITGTVTFTPAAAVLVVNDPDNPVTIINQPVTVPITDGRFSASLIATDDPDVIPTAWTYTVAFTLNSGAKLPGFSGISVPQDKTVDLTTVVPVPASGGKVPSGVGLPAGGKPGQFLVATNTGYAWADAPAGSGGTGLPSGGKSGQILSATGSGYAWVDAPKAGTTLPTGGKTGQMLTLTSSGYAWVDAPSPGTTLPVGGATGDALTKKSDGSLAWVPPSGAQLPTTIDKLMVPVEPYKALQTDDQGTPVWGDLNPYSVGLGDVLRLRFIPPGEAIPEGMYTVAFEQWNPEGDKRQI